MITNRTPRRHAVISAALLAFASGCGSIDDRADIVVHHRLAPSDSIGIEMGEDELMFGNISDACILEDGRVAVVDRVFRNVRVFTGSGEFIAEIAGTGSGPGEFLSPLFVSPWNSGLMVSSIMDMKELYFDSSCIFAGEVQFDDPDIRPGCPVRIQSVDDSLYIGDTFFMTVQKSGEISGGLEVSLWNGESRVRTFRSRTAEAFNPLTFQIDARVHSFFDPETGRLYWADASIDDYTVHCVDVATDSERVFVSREWDPVAKPDSIIQEERDFYIRSWIEGTGHDPDFEFTVNPFYNAVEGLGVDSLGRIWVRTGLERSTVFDVYDPDGAFLFDCTLSLPDWQDCDAWDVTVCREGFIAFPRNPGMYPVVYMLELVED